MQRPLPQDIYTFVSELTPDEIVYLLYKKQYISKLPRSTSPMTLPSRLARFFYLFCFISKIDLR